MWIKYNLNVADPIWVCASKKNKICRKELILLNLQEKGELVQTYIFSNNEKNCHSLVFRTCIKKPKC